MRVPAALAAPYIHAKVQQVFFSACQSHTALLVHGSQAAAKGVRMLAASVELELREGGTCLAFVYQGLLPVVL